MQTWTPWHKDQDRIIVAPESEWNKPLTGLVELGMDLFDVKHHETVHCDNATLMASCHCGEWYKAKPGGISHCNGPAWPLFADDLTRRIFQIIDANPQTLFLLPTKEPGRVKKCFPEIYQHKCGAKNPNWVAAGAANYTCECGDGVFRWERPNIILCAEFTTQSEADARIPELLRLANLCPQLWVHAKGLTEGVDLTHIVWPGLAKPGTASEPHRVDVLRGGYWEDRDVFYKGFVNHSDMPGKVTGVIVTGTDKPLHPAWARSLRDQTQAAGCRFWFRGWGEWVPFGCGGISDGWQRTRTDGKTVFGKLHRSEYQPQYKEIPVFDGREFETCWVGPNHDTCVKVGRDKSGNLLDGQAWEQVPEVEL